MKRIVLLAIILLGCGASVLCAQESIVVGIDQDTRAEWSAVADSFEERTGLKVTFQPYSRSNIAQQVVQQAMSPSKRIHFAMISLEWGQSIGRYLVDLRGELPLSLMENTELVVVDGRIVGVPISFAPGWFLGVLFWPDDRETAGEFLTLVATGDKDATIGLPVSPMAAIATFKTQKISALEHNPKMDGALEALLGAAQASFGAMATQVLSALPSSARAAIESVANLYGVPFSAATSTVTVVLESRPGRSSSSNVAALSALGISRAAIEASSSLIKVSVSLSQLESLAAQLGGVAFIRPPYTPYTLGTPSEGAGLIGADAFHAAGIRGGGVKVAVIDLGFSGLSQAQARGDLPYSAVENDLTGTGLSGGISHGTAVAEIIHDIAPDAQLYLIKIADEVDLDLAVTYCLDNGIDIINHSLGWYNTNFYDGTGTIGDIARRSITGGILWVNAAGNEAESHWEGTFTDGNSDGWNDQTLTFSASSGSPIILYLTWNEWPQAGTDYDLYLYDPMGTLIASSTKHQTGTEEPTESIQVTASQSGTYTARMKGVGSRKLEIYNLYQGLSPAIAASSILAPANVAEVIAVGAIDHTRYATGPQESYSSQGPTNDGRPKPDLCAPDNVSTGTAPYTTFPGTSGAAPHASAAAALLLSQEATLSEPALRGRLLSNTVAMGNANVFGRGRLALQPPAAPNQAPAALFVYSPPAPQVGASVVFNASGSSDPDGSIVSFGWEFGDGTTGSGMSTSHAFSSPGSFLVRLTVTDDDGASDSTEQAITVGEAPNQPPIAMFTASPSSASPGAMVSFDASGSHDPDGGIVSLSWAFGDGGSGSGVRVQHAFATPGTYTVRLAVTDNGGATDTATRTVSIQTAPLPDLVVVDFAFSATGPSVGQSIPFTITIANSGNADAGSFRVRLDGQGGVSSTSESVSGLPAGGRRSISLSLPLTLSVETFSVHLDDLRQVGEGNEGNNDAEVTVTAVTTPPPVAAPGGPYSGAPGVPVSFNGSGSSGSISSYVWTFGDGASGRGVTVSHVYAVPGTYSVSLTVVDSGGRQDAASTHASIAATQEPGISAQISLPKESYTVGEAIEISFTINRAAYVYLCDVSPDGRVTLLFPNAIEPNNYVEPGTHSIPGRGYTLRVDEPTGTETLYLFAASSRVSAFPTGYGSGFVVLSADPAGFRDSVLRVLQSQFATADWAFDSHAFSVVSSAAQRGALRVFSTPSGASVLLDGAFAGTTPIEQGSVTPGTHTIQLSLPGYRTETRQITIVSGRITQVQVTLVLTTPTNQPPTARFTASPTSAVIGSSIVFDGRSSIDDGAISSFMWSFGDGSYGSGSVVSHAYGAPGTYVVRLTVTDTQGAQNSTEGAVLVYGTPTFPVPTPPTPTPPFAVPGIYIWGTDRWHITVSAGSGWSTPRGYRIELRTDGAFHDINESFASGVTPLGLIPSSPQGEKSLIFEGSLQSGSVDRTFVVRDSESIWMSLLLDIDGDGDLDQSSSFVYLGGSMVRPPTSPLVVGLPEGSSSTLLPGIDFRIGSALTYTSSIRFIFWMTSMSALERR